MSIAALPTAVSTSLVFPRPEQSCANPQAETALPARQASREPKEHVLQGELLDRQKEHDQRRARQAYTAEGRAHRNGYSALYGEGPASPVEQYLATSELDVISLNTRPLIDLYV